MLFNINKKSNIGKAIFIYLFLPVTVFFIANFIVGLEPKLAWLISNIYAKGITILFLLLCLLKILKARHLLLNLLNLLNIAGRSDCYYFIISLSVLFPFLYITTMSESNLDYISLLISKWIEYDNRTIKYIYISLYWKGFLIFIPLVLNYFKLWLKKEKDTIDIKKLLLEILKTFVLVAFIIIILYLVANLIFNSFTYDFLIYLIVTWDIQLIFNIPVVFIWYNILLGKIFILILDIYLNLKKNPLNWMLTKVVFILNIAFARLILISIISSLFSPESLIVELVTFNWLSHIFNWLTFYWQLTFFNYYFSNIYLYNHLVEKNLINVQSNVNLYILNSHNPIFGTSCKLFENNAYLKSIKIYLYNGCSSLRENLLLYLDPLRSLATWVGRSSWNINTIPESKDSLLIFFIKEYTFFGRLNWNNTPVVNNSKCALPKYLNSGGYYPSYFQPLSLARLSHIYPTMVEELKLKIILNSPSFKSILYRDYWLFQKTGQVSRSWEIVRGLIERLNLSGVSAINSQTQPWGLRGVTLVVGSDWEGETVVGSELVLDLVVKGGTSPCIKLPDPQLCFSPEYIQSLSNVSLFTLGLEEDDNSSSSSSDSEESQEDLYEWATSLSLNLYKYISISFIKPEISSSAALNVREELVNTDSIPRPRGPVDFSLVKSILGVGNNIINYPAPTAASWFKKLSPIALGESLDYIFIKELSFLGGITNNLVYNQIIVLTSGISSYSSYGGGGAVFSFGLGGAGDDDGDEGDKNWKKHYDLLEKNRERIRERNKFLAKKRKLESTIATNDWNRVRVINELERLTQEISDQIAQLQFRLSYSIVRQEEIIYYSNLLQRYRARSEEIWRRLDEISRRNQELRRELDNL